MILTDLLKDEIPHFEGDAPDIKGLALDSRKVQAGFLFAALSGTLEDKQFYIDMALEKGASALLLAEEDKPLLSLPSHVPCILSKYPTELLANIARRFYGAIPKNLVAVTGTNGKSSVVSFVRQIWGAMGYKSASIGTVGAQIEGEDDNFYYGLTTPDILTLYQCLADFCAKGVTHVAIEASSHGLLQGRLSGLEFKSCGFTNLSRDHLDYHENMQDYLRAKLLLFSKYLEKDGSAVINSDIPEYHEISLSLKGNVDNILTYGHNSARIAIKSKRFVSMGYALELAFDEHEISVDFPLVGDFQIMNALCALGLVCGAEKKDSAYDVSEILALVGALKPVQGRLQLVPSDRGRVFVDYAHTPDALETILTTLRPHIKGKLICLVGCGGDRDKGKRPVMGKVAAQISDIAIITDDNPRTEDPEQIRLDMLAGIDETLMHKVENIADRRLAILRGLQLTQDDDVFVVAGKGHEQGQIIGTEVFPFDDVTEIEQSQKLNLSRKGTGS